MRLVVDGLFLRPGRVGGVEFMLYSLLAALASTKQPEDHILVLLSEGVELGDRAGVDQLEPVVVPAGNRFLGIERHLPRDRDAALFPNYYTPLAARNSDPPSLTVVHDLQFRAFPRNFTPAKRAFQHLAIRRTCRAAAGVVAISEFTAGELREVSPVVADRLTVIPNPVDWARFDEETAPEGHEDLAGSPFFLLAAAQYRHKNIATAIEGFREVRARRPRARMVLVGQVPDGLGETKVGGLLPSTPGVVQLGFVPDSVLAWLYRRAAGVLLPSLYEGCGLPAAEALGLGTSVIHSGRGALPEVVGGAGIAVADALDPASWAIAMTDVLDDTTRPEQRTVDSIRELHDVRPIGARYWRVIHDAQNTTASSDHPTVR